MIIQIIYFLLNLLAVLCFLLIASNIAVVFLVKDIKEKLAVAGVTKKDVINRNLFLFCLAMVCTLIAQWIG